MDRFIAALPATDDADLRRGDGFAYQADMSQRVYYDADYWDKCASHPQDMQDRINRARVDFVAKHYGPGAVLDIGIGDGAFIKSRPLTYGYDINPTAIRWLMRRDLLVDAVNGFDAYTMFDVLEHVENPEEYFVGMRRGSFLFVSIPIFADLSKVRESKHYRPGEHLVYFTNDGFLSWMSMHRWICQEHSTFESDAGRDSIHSYAFKRQH